MLHIINLFLVKYIMMKNIMKQVDKHIRKLDADLARFEAELKEKPLDEKKDNGVCLFCLFNVFHT